LNGRDAVEIAKRKLLSDNFLKSKSLHASQTSNYNHMVFQERNKTECIVKYF